MSQFKIGDPIMRMTSLANVSPLFSKQRRFAHVVTWARKASVWTTTLSLALMEPDVCVAYIRF